MYPLCLLFVFHVKLVTPLDGHISCKYADIFRTIWFHWIIFQVRVVLVFLALCVLVSFCLGVLCFIYNLFIVFCIYLLFTISIMGHFSVAAVR
jgi:hypothetical protein